MDIGLNMASIENRIDNTIDKHPLSEGKKYQVRPPRKPKESDDLFQ